MLQKCLLLLPGGCDGFGGQAGEQERQCWGVYKCFYAIQLTKRMSANKAVSASQHQSKVGACNSLMGSHLAPWARPGLLSWWLTQLPLFLSCTHQALPNICARCCCCVCQEKKSCYEAFAMCCCLALCLAPTVCPAEQFMMWKKDNIYQRGKITTDLWVLLLKQFVWLLCQALCFDPTVELGKTMNCFWKPWPCSLDGLHLSPDSTGSCHSAALPSVCKSINVHKLLPAVWHLLLYGS